MSRITKDDVLNAIAALEEAKQDVTILNIRTTLGRGSYSTISKHVAEYKASETVQIEKVTTLPTITVENLPSELLEWAQKMALEAATHFAHEREAALEAVKVEKNAKIKELAAQVTDANTMAEDAEAISEQQEKEIESLRQELSTQKGIHQSVTDELNRQIEELKASVAGANGEIKSLKETNSELLASLPKQRTTTAAKNQK